MSIYPWQTMQWQRVCAQHAQNRLPPAILLTGSAGLGKTHFAQLAAQKILCAQSDEYACGHCRSCRLFLSGNHPDFFNLQPPEESATIKVELIREVMASVQQKPQVCKFQVVIINPAEGLQVASSNALLKNLEEPLGNVIWLLVLNQPDALPRTLMSRCQRLNFQAEKQVALTWLDAQLPNPAQAALLLHLSNHAPLQALKLSEQNYFELRAQLFKLLIECNQQNFVHFSSQLAKENNLLIFQLWFSLCLDILRLQQHVQSNFLIHQDCLAEIQTLAKSLSHEHLIEWLADFQVMQDWLLKGIAINWTLWFEAMLIQWSQAYVG